MLTRIEKSVNLGYAVTSVHVNRLNRAALVNVQEMFGYSPKNGHGTGRSI